MVDKPDSRPDKSELDLLARYHLMEELSNSEKRYRSLVEQLHEIVFQADDQFHFTFLNNAWESVTGITVDEAIGKPIIEFIVEPDRSAWKEEMEKALNKNTLDRDIEVLCLDHADSGHRWVTIHMSRDAANRCWMGSMHDITERKRADALLFEKTRAEAEAQAKSQFLAKMSHELRTPIHAIISFSDFGIKKIDSAPKEKLQGYFSRIQESGSRLLGLINDLLDLSKLEAGHMQFNMREQDIVKVVEAAQAELQGLLKDKALTLVIEQSSTNTTAEFDNGKLLQVMINLLSNAIKFSPAGKNIRISFGESTLPVGQRSTDTGTVPALSLSVEDQGAGIPEDELDAVFDKFVQSSKTRSQTGGTGLGLAICKEIIEGHRGIIQAANTPEGGAVFTVTIPRYIQTTFY